MTIEGSISDAFPHSIKPSNMWNKMTLCSDFSILNQFITLRAFNKDSMKLYVNN